MPTSDQIFAVQQTTGFIHRGQIVYALQYDLETPPPRSRCLIVWLTPTGDATALWIQPSHTGKRIVTTKPGEHIRFKGELQKVTGVSIYRSLAMPVATISP
jgi:hypothetical protein